MTQTKTDSNESNENKKSEAMAELLIDGVSFTELKKYVEVSKVASYDTMLGLLKKHESSGDEILILKIKDIVYARSSALSSLLSLELREKLNSKIDRKKKRATAQLQSIFDRKSRQILDENPDLSPEKSQLLINELNALRQTLVKNSGLTESGLNDLFNKISQQIKSE